MVNATVLFGRINLPFKGILIAGQIKQVSLLSLRPHSAKLNEMDSAGYSTKLTRGQPAPPEVQPLMHPFILIPLLTEKVPVSLNLKLVTILTYLLSTKYIDKTAILLFIFL